MVLLPHEGAPRAAWRDRLSADVPEVEPLLVPDGADEDERAAALGEAEAAYGTLTPRLLAAAGRLRWLQAPQADPPEDFFFPALVDADVVVTNFRGIYDDSVGVHALTLLLAVARRLDRSFLRQRDREWAPSAVDGVVHLGGATLLVVGCGSIGAEVARLAAALGMRVLATDARRTDAPEGVAELHGPEALDELLPRADAVVNVLPHTPATEGTFDLRRFHRMPPGALYVTVGRGPTTRTDDLARALVEGHLGGAGVDVVDPEPLPAGSPLWDAPHLVLTPHVADRGPDTDDRRYQVLAENCRRYVRGEPLLTVVDKTLRF